MDKQVLIEHLDHFFQEATNLSSEIGKFLEIISPDQPEQAKLLNKEIEEFINHLSKLKAQNTVLAMKTGGSKSKKRYHRRRSTIRKKKRRKAKSIKRRRKRGRKTRKNKIN